MKYSFFFPIHKAKRVLYNVDKIYLMKTISINNNNYEYQAKKIKHLADLKRKKGEMKLNFGEEHL